MTFSVTSISASSFRSCARLPCSVAITAFASDLDLVSFATGIGDDRALRAIAHYLAHSLFAAIFRCLTARVSAVFVDFVFIYWNSYS